MRLLRKYVEAEFEQIERVLTEFTPWIYKLNVWGL